MTFEEVKRGYANLWAKMTIKPERVAAAHAIARRLAGNEPRYKAVASHIGCPWWFVAAIHNLESNADFTTHLHNGDPLDARTTHVPAGRPVEGSPPFTWIASAVDALRLKGLEMVVEWTIPRALYEWERYNGLGYFGKIRSPYLWSFSNIEEPGKYVADHVWDADAVSEQCGAAVILRAMMDLDLIDPAWEASTIEGNPMSELRDFVKQFAGLAPTLVTVLAGPAAGLAVRAIAEALTDEPGIDTGPTPVMPDPKIVVDKLQASPVSKVISVIQVAEAIIRVMQTANQPPIPPAIAPTETEVTTTTVATPEATPAGVNALDKMFPALVGWKTYIAIAFYVLGNIAAIFLPTIVTPDVMQAITWLAGGIGGAGLIEKVDRYISIFKPTVKTTTVATKAS